MTKQQNEAELLAITLMMKGLVAEAHAETEYINVMNYLSDIRDEYLQGTEAEKVAFIAAFTVFAAELDKYL